MGFERDMGLNFWDINFRGERIIYELTPQEAMAQYCELSVVQFLPTCNSQFESLQKLEWTPRNPQRSGSIERSVWVL
jgi:hypothetical protein